MVDRLVDQVRRQARAPSSAVSVAHHQRPLLPPRAAAPSRRPARRPRRRPPSPRRRGCGRSPSCRPSALEDLGPQAGRLEALDQRVVRVHAARPRATPGPASRADRISRRAGSAWATCRTSSSRSNAVSTARSACAAYFSSRPRCAASGRRPEVGRSTDSSPTRLPSSSASTPSSRSRGARRRGRRSGRREQHPVALELDRSDVGVEEAPSRPQPSARSSTGSSTETGSRRSSGTRGAPPARCRPRVTSSPSSTTDSVGDLEPDQLGHRLDHQLRSTGPSRRVGPAGVVRAVRRDSSDATTRNLSAAAGADHDHVVLPPGHL